MVLHNRFNYRKLQKTDDEEADERIDGLPYTVQVMLSWESMTALGGPVVPEV